MAMNSFPKKTTGVEVIRTLPHDNGKRENKYKDQIENE